MATSGDVTGVNKVDKTGIPFSTYITDPSGLQGVLAWALAATPLTFAVRDAAGQLQVGNPIIASDAVNLFTLEQKILTFYLVVARAPYTIWHGAITLDSFGAPISAAVVWPDGVTGTYTGTPSATHPGAVDAWTVTYDDGPFTFTQPAVTRDTNGNVIFQPAITIT